MRLHPGVAMPLERIVPQGGAEICGRFIPEGTVVGVHPWVIHRNESIFGKDAHEFRPDRWLECDPEQLKRMERNFLSVRFFISLCFSNVFQPIARMEAFFITKQRLT